METLLISLHPRHSQNILNKNKTIELRKKRPRVSQEFKFNEPGTKYYSPGFDFVLIYETVPTAQIVGFCTPSEVVSKIPDLWARDYKSNLCLTAQEIFAYLGDDIGYGIKLRKPQKISPIPLSKMREVGINPPQGYRYLSDKDINNLGISFN